MKVRCDYCGETVLVKGLGRKPLNLPVTIVCDSLEHTHSVRSTAELLGCSRAMVYKVLKLNGMTAKQFNVVRAKRRSSKRLRKVRH